MAPASIAYSESHFHDGESYQIEILQLPILKCGSCGEVILTNESDEQISDAIRSAAKLLSPIELRQKREQIGWSTLDLANATRSAEATIIRWENGGQLHRKIDDCLLRLIFDRADVRTQLLPTKLIPAISGSSLSLANSTNLTNATK